MHSVPNPNDAFGRALSGMQAEIKELRRSVIAANRRVQILERKVAALEAEKQVQAED